MRFRTVGIPIVIPIAALLVPLASAAATGPLSAQDGRAPARNERVRVSAPRLGVLNDEGRLLRAGTDTLVVLSDASADSLILPWSEVTALQVWHQPGVSGRGATLGGIVGAVVGGALGAYTQWRRDPYIAAGIPPLPRWQSTAPQVITGSAVFGAVVGAGYGAGGREGMARAPRGFAIGLGAGAAAGAVAGILVTASCQGGDDCTYLWIPVAVVSMGLAGGILGSALAAGRPAARWERVSLPFRAGLHPRGGGWVLEAALSL